MTTAITDDLTNQLIRLVINSSILNSATNKKFQRQQKIRESTRPKAINLIDPKVRKLINQFYEPSEATKKS